MRLPKIAAILLALIFQTSCERPRPSAATPSPTPIAEAVDPRAVMLEQLMAADKELDNVPFAEIVKHATGHQILPFQHDHPTESAILNALATVLDASLVELSAESSPVRGLRRINEASRFFEDAILRRLDELPDFECAIPTTTAGKAQRSGYPDLRIVHIPSGRIVYLDPKLYEKTSEKSSLRTFYFEPSSRTGKINDDAHHLLVGIAHDGNDGAWQFTEWNLVDLARFKVRLKAEFQASNRDLYHPDLRIPNPRTQN